MRIIAGTCRSLRLKTPKGLNTRPTTDRIKETLFNILQPQLGNARFLDLYSGSGGIGLEALSRGAKEAVFVENNKEAISCIEENIRFTKMNDRSKLLKMDVLSAIKRLNGVEAFDIIFMDPPYNNDYEKQVLASLMGTTLINSETIIVVEADVKTEFSYLLKMGYELQRYKKYKTNAHVFIKKMGEKHDESNLSGKL